MTCGWITASVIRQSIAILWPPFLFGFETDGRTGLEASPPTQSVLGYPMATQAQTATHQSNPVTQNWLRGGRIQKRAYGETRHVPNSQRSYARVAILDPSDTGDGIRSCADATRLLLDSDGFRNLSEIVLLDFQLPCPT